MVKSACVKVLLPGMIFSSLAFSGYGQANPQGTERGRGQTPPYVPNSIPNTRDHKGLPIRLPTAPTGMPTPSCRPFRSM